MRASGPHHTADTMSRWALWEKAVDALPQKDKDTLPLDRVTTPAELLADTNDRISRAKGKPVILPNGETFLVRDVLEKIAKWVKKFVEVGDVAAQYDPGHAALPWAALRLILQVSDRSSAAYSLHLTQESD